MNTNSNEDIDNLARLLTRFKAASDRNVPGSEMNKFHRGIAQLDRVGRAMLFVAKRLQEGKPYRFTTGNQETIDRVTSLANHMGAPIKVREHAMTTEIVIGPPPVKADWVFTEGRFRSGSMQRRGNVTNRGDEQ
jgi:hypothetical protein